MTLTPRQLNRATLARQLLLRRERLGVVEAVRRIVAIQAQEAPSPYIALWNRLQGFDAADLDRAFADGSIVKATSMRMTLHAIDARDYVPFIEAMQPSLSAVRPGDPRFTLAGLTSAEVDTLLPEVLEYMSEPRTNADIEAWMDARLAPNPGKPVWWGLRWFAPYVHAPTGGPWSFGPKPAYVAARDALTGDPEAQLEHLVQRYLDGFGPASIADVAQFAKVQRARAREALGRLVAVGSVVALGPGPGGVELFDIPDGPIPPDDTPAPPRLLGMWEETLLAYLDRSRIVPPAFKKLITRQNGDMLPTLLVDGYAAGVWRPVEGGIEATAFEPLSDDAWEGLDTEARSLIAFLADRQPLIYHGRFAHWWAKLPPGDVRVLGG